jgi:hypothetical protein
MGWLILGLFDFWQQQKKINAILASSSSFVARRRMSRGVVRPLVWASDQQSGYV